MKSAPSVQSPIPQELQFVRPADVSAAIGRSRTWAYNAISDGRLPAVRLFGVLRVRLADALKFIEQNSQPHSPDRLGLADSGAKDEDSGLERTEQPTVTTLRGGLR